MLYQPTDDSPWLVGILMDASVSMKYSGMTTLDTYLAIIETYIIDLFSTNASRLNQDFRYNKNIKLFACAFGLNHPISLLANTQKNRPVKDLWSNEQNQSVITLSSLVNHWEIYKAQTQTIQPVMYGTSAILAGLQHMNKIFEQQNQLHSYGNKILIMISDGEAADSSDEEVIEAAQAMQQDNILIITLYIANTLEITAKYIYAQEQAQWSQGAKLMFHCASMMSHESFVFSYLKGRLWEIPSYGKLFTQIQITALRNTISVKKSLNHTDAKKKDGIFVAYSTQDIPWLEQLKSHLVPLESQASLHLCVDNYYREASKTLNEWSNQIEVLLRASQVAIILISSHFMVSELLLSGVLAILLQRAKSRGTEIILLVVEPSRIRYEESMNAFDCINSPYQPLSALAEEDQNTVLTQLTTKVEAALL